MKPTPQQIVIAAKNTHAGNCDKCRTKTVSPTPSYLEAYARLHRIPHAKPVQDDLKSGTGHE